MPRKLTFRIEIPNDAKPDFNLVKKALRLGAADAARRVPGTQQFDVTLADDRHEFDVKAKARDAGYRIVSTTEHASMNEQVADGAFPLPDHEGKHYKESPKPYGMLALPEAFERREPIWHDGTSVSEPGSTTNDRLLSGEVRFEITALTPLLVGWERTSIEDAAASGGVHLSGGGAAGRNARHACLDAAAREVHSDPARAPSDTDDAFERKKARVQRARDKMVSDHDAAVAKALLTTGTVSLDLGWVGREKSVLAPLRTPWGARPVVIPGDTVHGFIRHHHGGLVGSPMERVAEQVYSYRPNMKFPMQPQGRRLEPRLAVVRAVATCSAEQGIEWRVPARVDVFPFLQRGQQDYYPSRDVAIPPVAAQRYRGGMGGGERMPAAALAEDARRRQIHTHLAPRAGVALEHVGIEPDECAIRGYVRTLRHYLDALHGHFSSRHPQVGHKVDVRDEAIKSLRKAASSNVFQVGDLIWVEWDTVDQRIVSFGWHYYYRWAYTDSVRSRNGAPRPGLFPLPEELRSIGLQLTPARRLFGYAADDHNPGVKGVGGEDYPQLMGRLFPNNAVEVVGPGDEDAARFLQPTFLKELGLPRPSAVEHYIVQDGGRRDGAVLRTYGDAEGLDAGGTLGGRKYYLDREDAYPAHDSLLHTHTAWADPSASNRINKLSTLALQATRPGRMFRFTLRFRDLAPRELAEVLLAMAPGQFGPGVGGTHEKGYCTKLGYARPLGWGSVRFEAKELWFLHDAADERWSGNDDSPDASSASDEAIDRMTPRREADVTGWFRQHFQSNNYPQLQAWLGLMRCCHPGAGDYPRKDGEIFKHHSSLRAEHSVQRRMSR